MAHINFSKEEEALHEILDRNNSAVHYRTPITCVTYARNAQDIEAIINTDEDTGVIKCNGAVIPEPSLSEVFKVVYNTKGGVMKW